MRHAEDDRKSSKTSGRRGARGQPRATSGQHGAGAVQGNGHEYRNPIGPQGRVILKVAADKINTPRRLGRR